MYISIIWGWFTAPIRMVILGIVYWVYHINQDISRPKRTHKTLGKLSQLYRWPERSSKHANRFKQIQMVHLQASLFERSRASHQLKPRQACTWWWWIRKRRRRRSQATSKHPQCWWHQQGLAATEWSRTVADCSQLVERCGNIASQHHILLSLAAGSGQRRRPP